MQQSHARWPFIWWILLKYVSFGFYTPKNISVPNDLVGE